MKNGNYLNIHSWLQNHKQCSTFRKYSHLACDVVHSDGLPWLRLGWLRMCMPRRADCLRILKPENYLSSRNSINIYIHTYTHTGAGIAQSG